MEVPLSPVIDNRKTPRVAISWRARVLLPGGVVLAVRTFDLSQGGVGLLCDLPMTLNVPLRVALEIPASAPGRAGLVVDSEARAVFQVLSGDVYRVGTQWVSPDAKPLAALAPWLDRIRSAEPG